MDGLGPRSRLAAVARVNYRKFQEYLQFLVERGYVTDGEVVYLTPQRRRGGGRAGKAVKRNAEPGGPPRKEAEVTPAEAKPF